MEKKLTKLITIIFHAYLISTNILPGTLEVDLTSGDCVNTIKSQITISNLHNETLEINNNYVCLENGEVKEIVDCSNQINTTWIIIKHFFYSLHTFSDSTEEFEYITRQCQCQSRCKNIQESPYTFKIDNNESIKYFTTQNPCIAFCLNGYEIYPASYIVNQYPQRNNTDSIKKGLDECYGQLDHSLEKWKQIAIMVAKFCEARFFCEHFKNTYINDIKASELAIYGEVLLDNTIILEENRFWNALTTTQIICDKFNTYDINSNISINLASYGEERFKNLCFKFSFNGNEFLEIIDSLTSLILTITNPIAKVDSLKSGFCGYIMQDSLNFQTATITDFHSNSGIIDYAFENYSISYDLLINYPQITFSSNNICECGKPEFENQVNLNLYDEFSLDLYCSTCVINNSNAQSKEFSTLQEKLAFYLSLETQRFDLI